MKYLVTTLLIIAFFGCKEKNQEIVNITGKVIDVTSYENKMTEDLSSLYDSLMFIPFKVESPIGAIKKIIVHKDNIYLWDKNGEKVWGFKSNGDSLFCIDKQGKGPDEYIRIHNFSVSDSGYVNILDIAQKAILKYDLKGEMIEREKFEKWVHQYCQVDGYEYFFSMSPDLQADAHYVKVYKNSKKIRSYFPANHYWYLNGTEFVRSGDSVFFTRRIDDCIYNFKDGILREAYNIDFGMDSAYKQKLRDAKNVDEHLELLKSRKYIGNIWDLCVSGTHIAFRYSSPVEGFEGSLRVNFFYNKGTKKGLTFNTFGHSNKEYFGVGIPMASDGHYFYALVNPWDLDEEQKQQLQELIDYPLEPNLNSVLCRFLIKM